MARSMALGCLLALVALSPVRAALAALRQPAPHQHVAHARAARTLVVAAVDVQEDAYAAGEGVVNSATRAQPKASKESRDRGVDLKAVVNSKPLGLVLAENPSGRGVFVADVVKGSQAETMVRRGDFLVEVTSRSGAPLKCAWLPLADVLAGFESREVPITLRLRRGGVEPWMLDRDGSGLSVEEMMNAAKSQFGRLIDDEQEEALRVSFAAIKESDKRSAAEDAITGGFSSETFRVASKLNFELRSFVQGARDAFDRLRTTIQNRALVDSKVAVQTAEYLLRRAIVDTSFILETGRATLTLDAAKKPAGRPQPFDDRLKAIDTARAMRQAPSPEDRLKLVAAKQESALGEEEAQKVESERAARMRGEAKALLMEAIEGVEKWARSAARENERQRVGDADTSAPAEEPDWELLQQRAALLGGEVATSVQRGLAVVRTDFSAFKRLRESGQLPTLMEEIVETNQPLTGEVCGRVW